MDHEKWELIQLIQLLQQSTHLCHAIKLPALPANKFQITCSIRYTLKNPKITPQFLFFPQMPLVQFPKNSNYISTKRGFPISFYLSSNMANLSLFLNYMHYLSSYTVNSTFLSLTRSDDIVWGMAKNLWP